MHKIILIDDNNAVISVKQVTADCTAQPGELVAPVNAPITLGLTFDPVTKDFTNGAGETVYTLPDMPAPAAPVDDGKIWNPESETYINRDGTPWVE